MLSGPVTTDAVAVKVRQESQHRSAPQKNTKYRIGTWSSAFMVRQKMVRNGRIAVFTAAWVARRQTRWGFWRVCRIYFLRVLHAEHEAEAFVPTWKAIRYSTIVWTDSARNGINCSIHTGIGLYTAIYFENYMHHFRNDAHLVNIIYCTVETARKAIHNKEFHLQARSGKRSPSSDVCSVMCEQKAYAVVFISCRHKYSVNRPWSGVLYSHWNSCSD